MDKAVASALLPAFDEADEAETQRQARRLLSRGLSMRVGEVNVPATLTCPAARGSGERHPLVVFSGGFATTGSQYDNFAEMLALGGCAVLRYDAPFASFSSDCEQVHVLRSLLDAAAGSRVVGRVADVDRVLLAGHSRGAKLSSLAALADERVQGLCLLDPVDNTRWTEGRSGFPSACEAMHRSSVVRTLPVAIVGAGAGGECAPWQANYLSFFNAAEGPAWLAVIPAAGHAQFLDRAGGRVERAICGSGGADDALVLSAAAAVTLAWTEVALGTPEARQEAGTRTLELDAARLEVARLSHLRLQSPARRQLAVSASVAAARTTDMLQRRGLEVESSLKA